MAFKYLKMLKISTLRQVSLFSYGLLKNMVLRAALSTIRSHCEIPKLPHILYKGNQLKMKFAREMRSQKDKYFKAFLPFLRVNYES